MEGLVLEPLLVHHDKTRHRAGTLDFLVNQSVNQTINHNHLMLTHKTSLKLDVFSRTDLCVLSRHDHYVTRTQICEHPERRVKHHLGEVFCPCSV